MTSRKKNLEAEQKMDRIPLRCWSSSLDYFNSIISRPWIYRNKIGRGVSADLRWHSTRWHLGSTGDVGLFPSYEFTKATGSQEKEDFSMVAHQLKSFCSFFKCKKSLEATDKIEKNCLWKTHKNSWNALLSNENLSFFK